MQWPTERNNQAVPASISETPFFRPIAHQHHCLRSEHMWVFTSFSLGVLINCVLFIRRADTRTRLEVRRAIP